MNIGLVAHDSKKKLMQNFCIAYRGILSKILGHKTISDEDLLKIMLWTFRISEMRFKYPAKLTIVIHKDKIDQINLLDIKSTKNGV